MISTAIIDISDAERERTRRFPWRAYAILLRLTILCHGSSAVLSQKVCRQYQQDRQNKHITVRNRRQFFWLCYGSEPAEAANLYGEAQLLMR
jgi:hypothetical protein